MNRKNLIIPLLLVCSSPFAQVLQTNTETGVLTWSNKNNNVYFSLTQLLPTQLKAFYTNRGFSLKQIDKYANSCVFMTVIRNEKVSEAIHFNQKKWSIKVNSQSYIKPRTADWLEILEDSNVIKSALIAFKWAQFPTEQEYQPGGDWNQGMLSLGLKADNKFDIMATWDSNNQNFNTTLKGISCAN